MKLQSTPSPLECEGYFLTLLQVSANSEYNHKKPAELSLEDLKINMESKPIEDQPGTWQLALFVQQPEIADRNIPYFFAIQMVGRFRAHQNYPAEKQELLIHVNGSSVLYSAARTILATALSHGPFPEIMLPMITFIKKPDEVMVMPNH